jgi:hypothetical protein
VKYFIHSNSFAAPWFSDEGHSFQIGDSPEDALLKFKASYSHPCGLFAAMCYASADDYHEGKSPLAKWLCNSQIERDRITKDMHGFSFLGEGPERFRINDTWYDIENPKEGRVLPVEESK